MSSFILFHLLELSFYVLYFFEMDWTCKLCPQDLIVCFYVCNFTGCCK